MTVGTLHVTVGCTASFTQFAPFSCCRPGPESVLSAPAAVACSSLHLDRYGSCRSARIRVGPRVSCHILPDAAAGLRWRGLAGPAHSPSQTKAWKVASTVALTVDCDRDLSLIHISEPTRPY